MKSLRFLTPLLLAAPLFAGTINIDGSTTVGPLAKAIAEDFKKANPGVEITLSESGSGNGAKSLINGMCDVAMLSRPLKDTEFKAAVENNVLPTMHVIAYDAIVLIAHPANPVKDLTLAQAKSIFDGTVKNWKELGGADLAIVPISRDTNSGTYETFEGMIMKGAKVTADAETAGSNGAVRQRVQTTPGAIGYVGIGYADRTTKALTAAGVEATPATVTTGRYPLSRPLFLCTNGYPALGSEIHRFVTAHLTKRGQSIVEEVGFVPMTSY